MSRRTGTVSLAGETKTANNPDSFQFCESLDLHHCRILCISQQLCLPAWVSLALVTGRGLHHLLHDKYYVRLGIIAMTERRNPLVVWKECYLWSFPYYLLGAMVAGGVSIINRSLGWQVAILVLPIVYWIYRSYRGYLDRLEREKKHTEEIADLHLRTIEALSLAIEAKDHNTHDHLKRVQAYAMQLGEDLGLGEAQLNALRAAAMLHDIGKLAVPEQILSKPGRLTPEEFEKMKIHPGVGAEILDRVQFPYPVVPIVRSHHEKWDGTGYPHGVRGGP